MIGICLHNKKKNVYKYNISSKNSQKIRRDACVISAYVYNNIYEASFSDIKSAYY